MSIAVPLNILEMPNGDTVSSHIGLNDFGEPLYFLELLLANGELMHIKKGLSQSEYNNFTNNSKEYALLGWIPKK